MCRVAFEKRAIVMLTSHVVSLNRLRAMEAVKYTIRQLSSIIMNCWIPWCS